MDAMSAMTAARMCKGCGHPFTPRKGRGGNNQCYCTRDCYREYRRGYMAAKMREYYGGPETNRARQYDRCSCGNRKTRKAARCKSCDAASRIGVKLGPKPKKSRQCTVCQIPFAESVWHGKLYLRCPGCGLERKVYSSFDLDWVKGKEAA